MTFLPDKMAAPGVRARAVELLDKAVVTAAEGALLAVGSDAVAAGALDLSQVDLGKVASYAAGGAVLSLLINLSRGGFSRRRGRHEA